MGELITIKIRDKKARKVLENLEEKKFIQIISDPLAGLTPKKKKQAKDFLLALHDAKLAEKGKIKLKSAESLLDEL